MASRTGENVKILCPGGCFRKGPTPRSRLTDRLVTAVSVGSFTGMLSGLTDGASVNDAPENGYSPLAVACRVAGVSKGRKYDGARAMVVHLLAAGADASAKSVLHTAVENSTVEIVQLLIDAGSDVAARCETAYMRLTKEGGVYFGHWGDEPSRTVLVSLLTADSASGEHSADMLTLLLSQPDLDLTVDRSEAGETLEMYASRGADARDRGWSDSAVGAILAEVTFRHRYPGPLPLDPSHCHSHHNVAVVLPVHAWRTRPHRRRDRR